MGMHQKGCARADLAYLSQAPATLVPKYIPCWGGGAHPSHPEVPREGGGCRGVSPCGQGMVGWHKEEQALRVGGTERALGAQQDGEQLGHSLGRTHSGFILASCGAAGLCCPRTAPCEPSCLTPPASDPVGATSTGHGLSQRPPAQPSSPITLRTVETLQGF